MCIYTYICTYICLYIYCYRLPRHHLPLRVKGRKHRPQHLHIIYMYIHISKYNHLPLRVKRRKHGPQHSKRLVHDHEKQGASAVLDGLLRVNLLLGVERRQRHGEDLYICMYVCIYEYINLLLGVERRQRHGEDLHIAPPFVYTIDAQMRICVYLWLYRG